MLEIKNEKIFNEVVDAALASVRQNATTADLRERWTNAILKAANLLQVGDLTFLTYDKEKGELLLLSDSNKIYSSNSVCQCVAFVEFGQPCWHRSAARLVRLYNELMDRIVEVPLTRGYVAIVDVEDAERVLQYKWTFFENKPGPNRPKQTRYARRSIQSNYKHTSIYLHRFIINAPDGVQVDHKNGDGLDCRKSNLRLATNSQNHYNIAVKPGASGYRGVIPQRRSGFNARIKVDGVKIHIGTFSTPEAAARAYDRKARQLHGEFATLNFPDEEEEDSFAVIGYMPLNIGRVNAIECSRDDCGWKGTTTQLLSCPSGQRLLCPKCETPELVAVGGQPLAVSGWGMLFEPIRAAFAGGGR